MVRPELAALDALGRMENHMRAVSDLAARLARLPLWQPAHALTKQAEEARRMMEQMRARLDRRLVVTLIGPSGAGKSTLLNALAGIDDLSPTGIRRPTTQSLVVLSNDAEAVSQLLGPLDAEQVTIRSDKAADLLGHMILVDTPDTDSTRQEAHLPLIHQAVAHSDVLLCVFDAQNPKRRDHVDLMAPLVRHFHGASLVAVVNKCDRLAAGELTDIIVPEFKAYLDEAWDSVPEAVLLVSARRHLQHPQWDPQAGPRHDLDQFDALRTLIFDTFNRPGAGPDRRLANARQLREYVIEQVRRAATEDRPALQAALAGIAAAEKAALREALANLRADERRLVLGLNVRLYQSLAQRWVGPVGWLVALWSRLMLFGTGLTALVRFGNPLRQIWGLIASWRRYKESSAALGALNDETRVDSALQSFRKVWWTHWPDIGEQLVRGRFDPQVRHMEDDGNQGAAEMARDLWRNGLDAEIERSAGRMSHLLLQLIFNLPTVALLGYVGWLTASRFLTHTIMAGDFFIHALLTIAIVLLLSFFLLQMVVRLAVSRNRIQQRAFRAVERAMGDHPLEAGGEVAEQAGRVIALAGD
ncbi:MAG: 50S ribosome-binding GTPase [Desulfatitalea sp.]|nr:50S ribosome-binding GTPase [Desulfatitalea sp.]